MKRSSAIAAGLQFYETGRPCKAGHIARRYSSSGECQVCEQARRAAAADRRRQQAADLYERTKPEVLARSAAWYAANSDKAKATRRAWHHTNPERSSALVSRRKARKLKASPAWNRELTELVDVEAAHLTRLREAATGLAWAVDHMIPLQCRSACGLHTWSNLQVIPALMNLRKFNRLELTERGEWIRHL